MLGIPQFEEKNILYPIELLYQKDDDTLVASEISIGTMHTLILCANGTLLSCGNSINGVLGIENVYDKITFPEKVGVDFFKTQNKELMRDNPQFKDYNDDFSLICQPTRIPTKIKYLDCSTYNSAFITNSGDLYMSGLKDLKPAKVNEDGTPVDEDEEKDGITEIINKITFFRAKVSFIALGKNHAICIAEAKAYSWGSNEYGVCGLSGKSTEERFKIPMPIEEIRSPSKMACVSDSHSMVLTVNGEIYSFGSNMYGKLGVADLKKYFAIGVEPIELEPVLVKSVSDVKYIACSNYHSACISKIKNDNQDVQVMYTWGNGLDGKLGHGNTDDYYEPKKIDDFFSEINGTKMPNIIKIALGDEFSLALDEKGKL